MELVALKAIRIRVSVDVTSRDSHAIKISKAAIKVRSENFS
jgi:hypothetical protein